MKVRTATAGLYKIKSNAIEELSSLLTADQYKEEIGKI